MTMLNWLDTSSRLGHNLAITLLLVLDALVGLGGLGRAHTYNSLLIELNVFVGLGGFGRAHNIPVILEQPFVGLGGFGRAHNNVPVILEQPFVGLGSFGYAHTAILHGLGLQMTSTQPLSKMSSG